MNPLLLAQLLSTIGTIADVGIPLILKLKQEIEAGKTATAVTDADLTELHRLQSLTAAQIFQREGVQLPT